MAADGRNRPRCGVRTTDLSGTVATSVRPAPPGARGGTPKSRDFSAGMYCGLLGLVTMLTLVDLNSGMVTTSSKLTVLERLIVRGRCQARCNELVSSLASAHCLFLSLSLFFLSLCVCMCVCVSVSHTLCVHMCVCVCSRARLCVCVSVCYSLSLCICVSVRVCVCVVTFSHSLTHTCSVSIC